MFQDTFQWSGTTSKKKGQKWGKERTSSHKQDDCEQACQDFPAVQNAGKKNTFDAVDFEKLTPYTDLPKVIILFLPTVSLWHVSSCQAPSVVNGPWRSMSQNSAIPGAKRCHYSGLWWKTPQYWPILTITASPKTVTYIRHSGYLITLQASTHVFYVFSAAFCYTIQSQNFIRCYESVNCAAFYSFGATKVVSSYIAGRKCYCLSID